MERQFLKIAGKEYPRVCNATLIGDWNEVKSFADARTIVPNIPEGEYDGIIIKGYEMKWNETNENYERYDKNAFDKFVKEYFVEKGLNLPVDINHQGWRDYRAICGKVVYLETNSVGFYPVVYIPRDFEGYDDLLWRLRHGIIQGFSKEGYATEYEFRYNPDGSFAYELIKEMKLLAMSLVTTPANGIAFENMQEVKNGLVYVNKTIEEKTQGGKKSLAELFN